MKFQNLSVKRLFGRVAIGLALSMSGITIALFLVTKQIAMLLTGGVLLLCAIVGIFVLTQAFGKRLSQFTTDLCQGVFVHKPLVYIPQLFQKLPTGQHLPGIFTKQVQQD